MKSSKANEIEDGMSSKDPDAEQDYFKWVSLKDLRSEMLSFPIDQLVAKKIIEAYLPS